MRKFLPLRPPDYGNIQENYRANLVYTLSWAGILVVTIIKTIEIIVAPMYWPREVEIIVSIDLGAIVSLLLNKKKHIRLASAVFPIVLWLVTTLMALTSGGILAPVIVAYLLIIMICGLIMGTRSGFMMAALCIFSTLIFTILYIRQGLPKEQIIHTPINIWLGYLIWGLQITIIQYIVSVDIRFFLKTITKETDERKQAEIALRSAFQRLSYLVENTPLALIEVDKELVIKRWSERAEEMFGWTASEVLGKCIYGADLSIIFKEDALGKDKIDELLVSRVDSWKRNLRNYTKSGHIIYSEWCISVLRDEEGKVITLMALILNVTERKKAEMELQQTNEELHRLSSHLQNIREEERMQIARDIHDDLGNQLTGLKMDMQWLDKKLQAEDEILKQKMNSIVEQIDETLKSVKRISSDLRPGLLDDFGLIAALEWHTEQVAKRSGIKVSFNSDVPEPDIPVNKATEIFRIYQELLTNAVRHANASTITGSLRLSDNHLILTIKDDGKGMDPDASGKKTLGLIGVKERTHALGGTYNLKSEQGKGTEVQISIPL
jgi:PAS domain S-box-containing protein